MNLQEVNKLVSFIEENTRADKVSGIDFIDPRNFKSKVQSRQNGVVFGRRGAGKSTLLKTLENSDNIFSIYVNLEDYKDITFPNIIIKVLVRFFKVSIENLKNESTVWKIQDYLRKRKLINKLKKEIAKLEKKQIRQTYWMKVEDINQEVRRKLRVV